MFGLPYTYFLPYAKVSPIELNALRLLMKLPDFIEKRFFEPWNLSAEKLLNVVSVLSRKDQIGADLYLEYKSAQQWSVEDRTFKDGNASCGYGAGLRTIVGAQVGFASTSDLHLSALLRQAARAGAFLGDFLDYTPSLTPHLLTPQHAMPYDWQCELQNDPEAIKSYLFQIDHAIRTLSPLFSQVLIDFSQSIRQCLIVREDGRFAWDRRPMIHLRVEGLWTLDGHTYTGSLGLGGRYSFEALLVKYSVQEIAEEIYRLALLEKSAQPAPSGPMPVILGPGWPAVLIHEAVGHGIEADFNRKKTSIYHDQIGFPVASPLCTIIDDGTCPNLRGSLAIDDEGEPTSKTVLIENGILKNFLFDRQNAALMNKKCTGNGRRESAFYPPMPRMTNTYMAPGTHSLEEMIASVDEGIYAINFGGGSVNITSGQFVFSTQEAYRIVKGKIQAPVKGATLIGIGPEVLKRISMVGSDFQHDRGVGTCGKNGQSVPVTVGQPSLKIDQLIVGGEHG